MSDVAGDLRFFTREAIGELGEFLLACSELPLLERDGNVVLRRLELERLLALAQRGFGAVELFHAFGQRSLTACHKMAAALEQLRFSRRIRHPACVRPAEAWPSISAVSRPG